MVLLGGCENYGVVEVKASLPRILAEISGMTTIDNSGIYAVTDHGNPNHVYKINTSGEIIQELIVANAKNEDWEDLASDGNGNLYIGDFGNNDNGRKDQAIYTIRNIGQYTKTVDTVEAIATRFTLGDQKEFPPETDNFNFDVEAFVFRNGMFHLFTRNRSQKDFNGKTKMYSIPADADNYVAEPVGDFFVCDKKYECAITGAALSPDGKTLLMITTDKLIRFTGFRNGNFFGGNSDVIDLKHRSRKESVCFKNETTVYMSDERRAATGGNLYQFTLPE
ncbi:MAG: hypothetical protein WBG71_14025 [Leeuwenhoekiella sp.]